MVDMSSNPEADGQRDAEDGGALVLDRDSASDRVAERLAVAIKRAGGQSAVMSRSGVKSTTLRRLLNGQDAKRGVLVAIADACGVSLEWLATGRGEMVPSVTMAMRTPDGAPAGHVAVRQRVPEEAPPVRPALPLFGSLDMDRMASCLESAFKLLQDRGAEVSWRRIVQIAAVLYDTEEPPPAGS
jgi:hypothetical protein